MIFETIKSFFVSLIEDHRKILLDIVTSLIAKEERVQKILNDHVVEVDKFLECGAPSNYEFPGHLNREFTVSIIRDILESNDVFANECVNFDGFRIVLEHKAPQVLLGDAENERL